MAELKAFGTLLIGAPRPAEERNYARETRCQEGGTPRPIPQGYEGATPYVCVKGAAAAEIRVGQAVIMLADEFPEMNSRSHSSLGGSPVTLHLYVGDVDAFAKRATAAGMKVLRPVENQFYGDRGGRFEDPFGHVWWIATHQEDLSEEEIRRRMASPFPPKHG